MIRDWQDFLIDHAAEWGFSTNGGWRFLVHNNYHPHCSNINVLWFQGKGEFPAVVTKLYSEPEIPRREFENLKRAYDCAPKWVPNPFHFGQQGSFWGLWMQGVPGTRYTAETRRSAASLQSMVDMVATLHRELAKAAAKPTNARYERLVSLPVNAVRNFGTSAVVREGCAKVAESITEEWIASLRVIPQHGDLFCDNLLLDRGQWHLIDWESLGIIDLPFYDLLTLLLSLAGAAEKAPESWDHALLRQMPELVQRYASALGLEAASVRRVLPLTLMNWFYLQWSDGRQEFSKRMYTMLERYFVSVDSWEKAFVGE